MLLNAYRRPMRQECLLYEREHPEEIFEFLGIRMNTVDLAPDGTLVIPVDAWQGTDEIRPGQWLVKYSETDHIVFDDNTFKRLFFTILDV